MCGHLNISSCQRMAGLPSGVEYANVDTLILVFSFGSFMASCSHCLRWKLEFGVNMMYTEAGRPASWGSRVTDASVFGLFGAFKVGPGLSEVVPGWRLWLLPACGWCPTCDSPPRANGGAPANAEPFFLHSVGLNASTASPTTVACTLKGVET